MTVMNLGGLGDLNTRIADAEKLYFNLAPYINAAAKVNAPDTGGQRDRDVKSYGRGMERGAKLFTEGRINALRQQRGGLNAGTDANIPYEAFDPKNLSSDNNVYETPENIAARNGYGDTSGSNAPPGGNSYIPGEMHFAWVTRPNGAMVYTLVDENNLEALNPTATGTAVNQQAREQSLLTEQGEYHSAQEAPKFIRDNYTAAAQHAGTYADTDEFKRGLDYEVDLGTQGAQKVSLDRINALRAGRGLQPITSIDQNVQTNYSPEMLRVIDDWNRTQATSTTPAVGSTSGPTAPQQTALAAPTTPGAPVAQTINTAPKPLVSSQPATVADNATGSAGPTTEDKPATGETAPAAETAPTAVKNYSNDLTSGKAINSRVSRMRALKTRSL